MADTIATREFIERTLDERVGVINTRLQDISGSTAENTADLLSAVSSDVNETFSRMEQEGITVESRTTADLKNALVRTINKVAEESAGSGGGGGTVTPPAEEEPVNLLQAPVTMTADMTSEGSGELMETLNYSFGFEIGKYYTLKGTYGENNTPFEFSSMVFDMEGMTMFYGMDKEESLVVVIYDKIAMDEETGDPTPSDTNSTVIISANVDMYPAPITVNSIALAVRKADCLNDIVVEDSDVTVNYVHYVDESEGIDAYMPLVCANLPIDPTFTEGTISGVALKVGGRALAANTAFGTLKIGVGIGFTENALEAAGFFGNATGSGTLGLIKGHRINYFIFDETTGDMDYELVEDENSMAVIGYFEFVDATTEEPVTDIVFYRPTLSEALSVSDKIIDAATYVFIAGSGSVDYEPRFFDLTRVNRLRNYAFAGFYFKEDLYIPENIEYVDDYALADISAHNIEFDENCMQNQSSGTTLHLDDASFDNIKFRAKDCASFKNAHQNGTNPIYMASPGSFTRDMFRNAVLFSVNSENKDEWIFNNDVETYLNIGENAFAISTGYPNTATLTLNYPNVTNLYLSNPYFNFNKVTINVPNCTQYSGFYRVEELNLKELTINISDEISFPGSFYVGGGDGLEKLVAPHFIVKFERHNSNRTSLKYLDVHSIGMVFNEDGNALGAFSNLETLILRSTIYDLDKYLSNDSAIMLGNTPVYVRDQDLNFYSTQYTDTSIVFRSISELA